VHLIVVSIASLPQGNHVSVDLALFSIVIIEVMAYTRRPYNIVLSAVIIILAVASQQPMKAWNLLLSRPAVENLLSLGCFLIILIFAFDRLGVFVRQLAQQRTYIVRLEGAISQLTRANVGFQQYANIIEERSTVEERKRITREIHDTVGYTLTNIIMMMEDALLLSDGNSTELRRLFQQTRDQAQTGLNETRRALRLLRAAETPRLSARHFVGRIVEAFEKATNVDIAVEYGNLADTYGDDIDRFICHMLQEGMANAFRHGKAERIRIYFWQSDSELIVTVHDNGQGCADIVEGIGLSGMKERIFIFEGQFKAENVVDGFQICARIPVSLE